ncbi:GNAT family N-acetyltransferase [Brevibacillus choshinensis]|uniref:GNAT family N-acetyltransferase n=1 Tax=Brevibacillus choshinensis TaxID=54911 RepID=A0ABX7FQM7_BRECH|nr:GNAT family N-acetyltransferase [Brevibacillus choshinensis]QRG67979.1 GNAT family N-acetyltransferase [Brevibacillus choshinensis]
MISLMRTSADHPDFHGLVELLDKDLWNRYPETQQSFAPFNVIKLDAKVVVAYADHIPVGCGCFRERAENGVVEIKRMYIKEEARGKGIAKQILRELEAWAVEIGKERAILETGTNQPEAVSLYDSVGYAIIDRFEPYVNSEESICMGKTLFSK